MKTLLTILCNVVILSAALSQGNKKLIIDVTSDDPALHRSVMLVVGIMSERQPDTEIEVMVYGKAIRMLMKDETSIAEQLSFFEGNRMITFSACQLSMDLLAVHTRDLVPKAQTVGNAVTAIMQKQSEGWAYIKSGI